MTNVEFEVVDGQTTNKQPLIITRRELFDKNACAQQLGIFEALFGRQVTVTPELMRQHAQLFSWDWVAEEYLFGGKKEAFYKKAAVIRNSTCNKTVPNCCMLYNTEIVEVLINLWLNSDEEKQS